MYILHELRFIPNFDKSVMCDAVTYRASVRDLFILMCEKSNLMEKDTKKNNLFSLKIDRNLQLYTLLSSFFNSLGGTIISQVALL